MTKRGSLAKLINGCSHRDRRAFEILYQQSPPKQYWICPSLRKKENLVEDLLQELFTRMWRRSGRFGSFKRNRDELDDQDRTQSNVEFIT